VRRRTLAVWQLERVQFRPFEKVIPMQNDVVEKRENPLSEIGYHEQGTWCTEEAIERAIRERLYNARTSRDFETRKKRVSLAVPRGAMEKKNVQVTDAADLEIDTRSMTFVFLSGRRYNRRERLEKEVESSNGGSFINHCTDSEISEGGIVQRRNQYIHYATTTQRPDKVNYDTEGLLA